MKTGESDKETEDSYPCGLDLVRDRDEKLLVLGCILAANQDFNRKSTSFELLQMLGCFDCQACAIRKESVERSAYLSFAL